MQDLSFLHTVNHLEVLFKDLIEALNSEEMKQGIASLKNLDLSEELETLTKEDAQRLLDTYAMLQTNAPYLGILPLLKDTLPEGYLETLTYAIKEIEAYLEILPKIANGTIQEGEAEYFILVQGAKIRAKNRRPLKSNY